MYFGVVGPLFGVFGPLFGVFGFWFGVFGVLVGVLGILVSVIGVFVIGILYLLHLDGLAAQSKAKAIGQNKISSANQRPAFQIIFFFFLVLL